MMGHVLPYSVYGQSQTAPVAVRVVQTQSAIWLQLVPSQNRPLPWTPVWVTQKISLAAVIFFFHFMKQNKGIFNLPAYSFQVADQTIRPLVLVQKPVKI